MSLNMQPVSVPTAEQPAIHTDNITAHPGSTFAGIGLWASGLFQMIGSTGMPVGTAGWALFGLQAMGGLFAILGK